MESLDAGQRSRAIIYENAPADIVTFNSTKASLPREEGLPASRMSGTQKELLIALVAEYVGRVPSDLALEKLESLKGEGIERLHLAWGGPMSRAQPHYYRIHGGNFLVEHDNRQKGANHIHSVWRDVENDFAQGRASRAPSPLPPDLGLLFITSKRLMKKGSTEGRSPVAGPPQADEGVSQIRIPPPSWPGPVLSLPKERGSGGWSEGFFRTPPGLHCHVPGFARLPDELRHPDEERGRLQ